MDLQAQPTETAPAAAPVVKPGYSTSEFWLSAAVTIIGLLMASGIVRPGSAWDQAIGIGLSTLTALGYTAQRGNVKSGK